MISNYDIRENTFTRNSVYILLLKADEKGREDVEREIADHCKLIDAKVPGFNYVFELCDVTDKNSLEKIKTRMEVLSSSGVAETFNNSYRTLTIDLESSKLKKSQQTKKDFEIENDDPPSINLANTGFPISIEQKDETSFKDIITSSSLIPGEEKNIDIGESSLELAKTFTDIHPKSKDVTSNKVPGIEQEKRGKLSVPSETTNNIQTEVEMRKTKLFGNIFGKIKTVIHPKKDKKNQTLFFKKKANISKINNKKIKTPKQTNNDLEQKIFSLYKQDDSFQNLGEGLISKKNLLKDSNPPSSVEQKKEEAADNAVTARIQVDDIFAAETVCDFYEENQAEGIAQDSDNVFEEKKTPLERLEEQVPEHKTIQDANSTKRESSVNIKVSSDSKTSLDTKTSSNSKASSDTKKISSEKVEKENKEKTSPEQIFAQDNLKDKQEISCLEKEGKKDKEKPDISETKGPKKTEITKIDAERTNKKTEEVEVKEEKQYSKFDNKEVKENMKEEKKEMSAVSKVKANKQPSNKTINIGKGEMRRNMKIDHTLHIATPSKDTKYRNYPIEMPLVPTYTFANMDISAIRFAHAMAMATLDDLGKGNNPFLLQGNSGTGKTHFLHAMGYEISKKIPQAKILFTNGVRFSRGVQYLLEKGQKEKLDNFFSEAEVLIIDDVHLTAVNEHNREYISTILNDFLKNKKQIILSSKYPPESLKRFEELVNFKFSLGTIAELKVPGKDHFERLTNRIVTSSFLDLTEKQVQTFFTQKSTSLGDVARNVKRVKVLSRRIESSGIKKLSYEEILQQMTAVNGENPESEISKKDFEEITALEKNKEGSWGNFGFFFPVSQIEKFRWVAFAAQEAAKELGIKGGFNYALKSAYSTDHIISAAFKIANICDLKNLKGAVILGPSFTECKEPIRDNFYDILTHMLEVMMIRCGTINFEDIKKPSAYIKMLGDILR